MENWINQLYKSKGGFAANSLVSRRTDFVNTRKNRRNSLLQELRQIPSCMSPIVPDVSQSSAKKKECSVKTSPIKKSETVVKTTRLQMLEKWKLEKQKKKLEDQKKRKPLFKVCHVEASDNLSEIFTHLKGINIKEIRNKSITPKIESHPGMSASSSSSTKTNSANYTRKKRLGTAKTKVPNKIIEEKSLSTVKHSLNKSGAIEKNKKPINVSKRGQSTSKDNKENCNTEFLRSSKTQNVSSTKVSLRNRVNTPQILVTPSSTETNHVDKFNKANEKKARKKPRGSSLKEVQTDADVLNTTKYETIISDSDDNKEGRLRKRRNSIRLLQQSVERLDKVMNLGRRRRISYLQKCDDEMPLDTPSATSQLQEQESKVASSGNSGLMQRSTEKKKRRKSFATLAEESNVDNNDSFVKINCDSGPLTNGENTESDRPRRRRSVLLLDVVTYSNSGVTEQSSEKKTRRKSLISLAEESNVETDLSGNSSCAKINGDSDPLPNSEKRKSVTPRSSRRSFLQLDVDNDSNSSLNEDKNMTVSTNSSSTRNFHLKTEVLGDNSKEEKTSARSLRKKNSSRYSSASSQVNELFLTPNGTSEDDVFRTPNKTAIEEEIVYISPYVTTSRGKRESRNEYFHRRSKSLNSSLANAELGPRSPKAAAVYFTKLLNDEVSRIQELCAVWQNYKEAGGLSEDACGLIDMTIGQSNLLISKKFNQFRQLIEKCRSNDSSDMKIECEDLHGFWDVMYKQVNDLNKRFENLEDMKKNNWLEDVPKKKTPKKIKARKVVKTSTRATSSLLKQAMMAGRMKKAQQRNEDIVEIVTTKKFTPVSRKSLSSNATPVKSILKTNSSRSEKQKTVAFSTVTLSKDRGSLRRRTRSHSLSLIKGKLNFD